MELKTFADYIKIKRAEKNLSRSEMARRAGFTPHSKIELMPVKIFEIQKPCEKP